MVCADEWMHTSLGFCMLRLIRDVVDVVYGIAKNESFLKNMIEEKKSS